MQEIILHYEKALKERQNRIEELNHIIFLAKKEIKSLRARNAELSLILENQKSSSEFAWNHIQWLESILEQFMPEDDDELVLIDD